MCGQGFTGRVKEAGPRLRDPYGRGKGDFTQPRAHTILTIVIVLINLRAHSFGRLCSPYLNCFLSGES